MPSCSRFKCRHPSRENENDMRACSDQPRAWVREIVPREERMIEEALWVPKAPAALCFPSAGYQGESCASESGASVLCWARKAPKLGNGGGGDPKKGSAHVSLSTSPGSLLLPSLPAECRQSRGYSAPASFSPQRRFAQSERMGEQDGPATFTPWVRLQRRAHSASIRQEVMVCRRTSFLGRLWSLICRFLKGCFC